MKGNKSLLSKNEEIDFRKTINNNSNQNYKLFDRLGTANESTEYYRFPSRKVHSSRSDYFIWAISYGS